MEFDLDDGGFEVGGGRVSRVSRVSWSGGSEFPSIGSGEILELAGGREGTPPRGGAPAPDRLAVPARASADRLGAGWVERLPGARPPSPRPPSPVA
jgi:hypothetical protein